MEIKPKVNPQDKCIVEFINGQPIPAICVGLEAELDRIHYIMELQLIGGNTLIKVWDSVYIKTS